MLNQFLAKIASCSGHGQRTVRKVWHFVSHLIKGRPFLVVLTAFNYLFNEFYPASTIINIGKIQFQGTGFTANQTSTNGIGDIHEEVTKSFKEGFRVT